MAIVSDIEIRLRADIARLQQDMTAARQQVGGAMERITASAKMAAGALAGLGAGLAIGAFAGFIKKAIDATDVVSDLSQKTGIAIKDIAGLQLWFQKGGTEAGDFESSMIKLSKNIADGAQVFDRLGIKTKDAGGALRSNVDVLKDLADRFAGLEDGTLKTSLAIEAVGKSGAKLIPLLNEGSEGLAAMNEMATKLGITFDEKTVNAAGDFNDTLDFLGLAAQGVGRQVAAQLLPTLQSLAGSMLDFVTKGDGVKKAADVIATGFKIIYSAGVVVTTLFTSVGKIIAGAMAAITVSMGNAVNILSKILHGDFTGAWEAMRSAATQNVGIVKETVRDLGEGVGDAAKTVSDVWSGAGGASVAAMAAITKNSTKVKDVVTADQQKQIDKYRDLLATINERIATSKREAAGLGEYNEAQKFEIKLNEELANGKVKLTAVQEATLRGRVKEYGANLAAVESQKKYNAMIEESAKREKALEDSRAEVIKKATDEAEANEKLVDTFGLTASAIGELELARMKEQLAQRSSTAMTLDEIEQLELLIALKERSVKAVAAREQMQETQKFWTDVEKTAHDTFVSIADGGKNAFTRLKESAKNIFFEWLYQMTLKKWVINVGASLDGSSAVAALAGGGNGGLLGAAGSADGLMSGVSSLYGAITGGATLAGGLGTGFLGSLAGGLNGAGAGAGLTSALGVQIGNSIAGVVGPSVAGAISTGLGAVATALPWVAGAAAIYTIGKKAFGMGPKEYADNSTLNGTIGAGFSGSIDTAWKKEGGWFRSDKNGVDKAAVDAAVSSGLVSTYKSIQDVTKSYADVLGLNADSIMKRTQTISVSLGKDEAANQKAISDFFVGVGNAIATELLPTIGQFTAEGETASATLQRLAADFQIVDVILAAMGTDSQTAFKAVGAASIEARESLIKLAGGLDALASQTQYFNENFLTAAEKIAPIQKEVNEQLAAFGHAGTTSIEQYKSIVQGLVSSGALATEEGRKQYATLLALAPKFKMVADYLTEASNAADEAAKTAAEAVKAADDAAKQAEQDLVDTLRGTAQSAFDTLRRSVDSRKDELKSSFDDLMAGIEASIERATGKVADLQSLSQALKATNLPGTTMDRATAQAQIAGALALARAGGVLPKADEIKDALAALNGDTSSQFSTLADFQRDQLLTANNIEELSGITDDQLSIAQKTLKALQDQKASEQASFDREIARLDNLVSAAQSQLDAINGVNNSVLAVPAAFSQFASSIIAALGNKTIAAQPTVTPQTQIEALYQSLLGRPGDAAGIGFFQDKYNQGLTTIAEIEKAIKNSAEYQASHPPVVADNQGSGTMSQTSANQAAINSEMQTAMNRTAAAVEQLASQFNQVSAGGNALLTENA
jgi:hypothetical protein